MDSQSPNYFDDKLAVWGKKQAILGFWDAEHRSQTQALELTQNILIWAPSISIEHLESVWEKLALYENQNYCHRSFHVAQHSVVLVQSSAPIARLKKQLLVADFEIDVCVLQDIPKLNEPGLLVMDMDSTTIQIECIDEIASLAGVGEQVSSVTASAMRGELDFEQSLRQRVGLLENASESVLKEVADNMPLMPGLELLLSTLKDNGWKTALASGGFTYFANALQREHGFDFVRANELEINNGLLSGKVQGSVIDAQAKADALQIWAKEYDINPAQTVAVGDGANDLKMMDAAGLGLAIHAKPLVVQQAQAAARFSDLEAVLVLLSAGQKLV